MSSAKLTCYQLPKHRSYVLIATPDGYMDALFESRLPWEHFEHTVSDHGVYIYMFGGRDIFNNLVNSLRMVKGLG